MGWSRWQRLGLLPRRSDPVAHYWGGMMRTRWAIRKLSASGALPEFLALAELSR